MVEYKVHTSTILRCPYTLLDVEIVGYPLITLSESHRVVGRSDAIETSITVLASARERVIDALKAESIMHHEREYPEDGEQTTLVFNDDLLRVVSVLETHNGFIPKVSGDQAFSIVKHERVGFTNAAGVSEFRAELTRRINSP